MVTIRKATADEKGHALRNASCYFILKNGFLVGTIVKHKNTRTDIHPWKVYTEGVAAPAGVFYDDVDSVKIGPAFDYNTCKIGGKTAAFVFARRHFG